MNKIMKTIILGEEKQRPFLEHLVFYFTSNFPFKQPFSEIAFWEKKNRESQTFLEVLLQVLLGPHFFFLLGKTLERIKDFDKIEDNQSRHSFEYLMQPIQEALNSVSRETRYFFVLLMKLLINFEKLDTGAFWSEVKRILLSIFTQALAQSQNQNLEELNLLFEQRTFLKLAVQKLSNGTRSCQQKTFQFLQDLELLENLKSFPTNVSLVDQHLTPFQQILRNFQDITLKTLKNKPSPTVDYEE